MINIDRVLKKIGYDVVIGPFFLVIFPGIALQGIIEYSTTGFSIYLLRDIANVVIYSIGILLYKFSYITKRELITLSLYTIMIASALTFVVGYFDDNFVFESTFLHFEIVIILVFIGAGMMIDLKHLLAFNIINVLLIVFCAFTVGKNHSSAQFIFYALLVSGGGFMAYLGRNFVRSLYRKVKKAQAINEKQNIELKQMNTMKDQLFKIISHDLKTPFHQLNQLGDLVSEIKSLDQLEEYRTLIKESALQGTLLLEDLLSWSKSIDEQNLKLQKIKVGQIIDKTIDFYKFSSGEKRIHIRNEIEKDLELMANDTMIETIFRNLIGNAIKFSYPNSDVVIMSTMKRGSVDIAVMDQGVGISSERISRLLSGNRSISTVGTNNEKGTGYGLGIVKRLVERQKGIVGIQSSVDKGTTVTVTFPKEV